MSALLKKRVGSRPGRGSIRTKVLAIALVPSFVFLLTGAAVAGYLVYDAIQVRTFATKINEAALPAGRFFAAVREERRLTLQELAKPGAVRSDLEVQRQQTDAATGTMAAVLGDLAGDAPANVQRSIGAVSQQMAALPEMRQRVDASQVSLQETYDFYNRIIDEFTIGLNGVAQETPTAETAYLRLIAMPLFTSADGMSRGDALAVAGMSGGGLTEQEFRTYISQVGAYHASLSSAVPEMIPPVRQQYDKLISSPAWERLAVVENAFLRGNQTELPVPEAQWRDAAREVATTLWNLYVQQSTDATEVALDEADQTLTISIVAGAAVLVVAIGALLIAVRLSNRLVHRLTALREDTLDLAGEQLPQLVERVRAGESVDLEAEVSLLDHGDDEIGQVAEAFNTAQQTAIAAAVEEAKTREGTKRVFLNIAHRSQVIVHRQLQALDKAERKQEDPEQLDMLFRLDHLSTRARRNAENLIILGGEQPGRQWRNPVALTDLVRGAMAEAEDYQRVIVGKLPTMAVTGPAVGDLVHLLAELIDNATSFSPPRSRVEVGGDIVGRGIVIEVEDQGLGIEPEQLEQFNEMLRNPPDFSFMALSEEPRLGLFVVARLAAKHGITVTLRESAYGGTRAIVLVRNELLSAVPEPDDTKAAAEIEEPVLPVQQAAPVLGRRPRPWPAAPDEAGAASPNDAPGHDEATRQLRLPRQGRHAQHTPAQPSPAPNGPTQHNPAQDSRTSDRAQDARVQNGPTRNGPAQNAPAQKGRAQEGRVQDSRAQEGAPSMFFSSAARPPEAGAGSAEARQRQAAAPAPAGPMPPDRPALPRRRRQQNLAPQLMDTTPEHEQAEAETHTPEQARSRLAAFQRGTQQARVEHGLDRDDHSGD